MAQPQPELLFVYNADAGLLPGLLDAIHKVVSPGTYACSLCALTYGATSMRPEWREFLRQLPARTTFLHRDELRRQFPELAAVALPAIFHRPVAESWQLLLTATELQALDLAGLMQALQEKLHLPAE